MNLLLKPERQFDTVIDFGTLEHVFNIPVALQNVSALCKRGGRIIHALPANNYNGHGFYQFSPELLFSVYSRKNGFSDTEVFIAEVTDHQHWWRAAVPANGVRVEYTSAQRSYVLAIAWKAEDATEQAVQQSDYVANWQGAEINPTSRRPLAREALRNVLRKVPGMWRFARTLNTYENAEYHALSANNPGYDKIRITALVGG